MTDEMIKHMASAMEKSYEGRHWDLEAMAIAAIKAIELDHFIVPHKDLRRLISEISTQPINASSAGIRYQAISSDEMADKLLSGFQPNASSQAE